MSKFISLIFSCFCILLLLTGCGVKGPLYQTPTEPVKKTEQQQEKTDINHNKEQSHYQQEKR